MDLREMQDDYRKVTATKLGVGALVETVLGEEDGLTLKPGKTTRTKKLVVVGVDKANDLAVLNGPSWRT